MQPERGHIVWGIGEGLGGSVVGRRHGPPTQSQHLAREAADSLWLLELPARARCWLGRTGKPTLSLSEAAFLSRDQAIAALEQLREPAIAVALDGILAELLRLMERAHRVRAGVVNEIAETIEQEPDLFNRRAG